MKKNKLAQNLVIFTLIFAGLIVLLVVLTDKSKDATAHVTFEVSPAIDHQPVLGKPDAPVTMIEYGDYVCPACKTWNERIFPQLKEEYIDTGIANFVFINTLFHGEESKLASLAAEAVWAQDEEAFWTYHEALFNKQPVQNQHTPWVTEEVLIDLAQNHTADFINLDLLKEDLLQETYNNQLIEDMRLVRDYEIEFTPSLMINNTLVENPFDYDAIVSLIESELGKDE